MRTRMDKTGQASCQLPAASCQCEFEVDDDCCTQIYGMQLTMLDIKSKYNKSLILSREREGVKDCELSSAQSDQTIVCS